MKTTRLQSALNLLVRPRAAASTTTHTQQPFQIRCAHKRTTPSIPSPIPFVPDVQTFLRLIGRRLSEHAAKFPTWEAFFSLTSEQLKELGIEPPRTRRYLIKWRELYRQGKFGPGGDIRYAQDGKAKFVIEETEVTPLDTRSRAVNIPLDKDLSEVASQDRVTVKGYKVGRQTVTGPGALPLEGGKAALVTASEGMWQNIRGRKIDGGERRRKEILFKKRVAERRAQREALGFT